MGGASYSPNQSNPISPRDDLEICQRMECFIKMGCLIAIGHFGKNWVRWHTTTKLPAEVPFFGPLPIFHGAVYFFHLMHYCHCYCSVLCGKLTPWVCNHSKDKCVGFVTLPKGSILGVFRVCACLRAHASACVCVCVCANMWELAGLSWPYEPLKQLVLRHHQVLFIYTTNWLLIYNWLCEC